MHSKNGLLFVLVCYSSVLIFLIYPYMTVDKNDAYINELERGKAFDAFLQTLPEDKRAVIGHIVSALVRQEVDNDTAQTFRADDGYLHLRECARAVATLRGRISNELKFSPGKHLADSPEDITKVSEQANAAIRFRVECALDAGMPPHAIRTRKTDGLDQDDIALDGV